MITATPTADEHITARLAALTTQRAERQDELDLPRHLTQRQVNAYLADTATLDRGIAAVHAAVAALAVLGSVQTDTKWRDDLTAWRATLSAELLAIRSPIRDRHLMDLAQNVTLGIKLIDFGLGVMTIGVVTLAPLRIGELMAASGYATSGPELHGPAGWRGSLKEVEQRIKDHARQRATAQATLDEALLDDDARATRDAEDLALREAFNAMHVRNSADPKVPGLVAYTEDGAVLPVSAMTPLQRKAFERANAAYAPRRTEPAPAA
jgi:hypothetical protein